MHEAIDYNALGWVRKELGETLKQARLQLEDYAADTANEILLRNCATQLHEALGPLQMVGIKAAVLLTTEMEELVSDLLQGTVDQSETAIELLMQAFLQLPDYLSSIRSGREDKSQALLPLINSLRATRGEQPLQKTAIFSPNLSVRVPSSIFDVRADPARQDVQSMARAARIRFQGGLLEWYRNAESHAGLQTLVEVLEDLQQCAASEPAARIWWVGAGVAEALRDGLLDESVETKQLFGQLDRQIRRLMDTGEGVFDDVLSDDLMKNLLFRVAQATSESERIRLIRKTYDIKQQSTDCEVTESVSDELVACSDEIMQTVAVTIRSDIDHIKEQLDHYAHGDDHDMQLLLPVADDLHTLENTLGMIGKVEQSEAIAAQEQAVREFVSGNDMTANFELVVLANTLVSIDDALGDIVDDGAESKAFKQGVDAVTREAASSMGLAKDAISEFIKSSGDFESLSVVPDLLYQISGGLNLVGQDRAAVALDQTKQFITRELIEQHQSLDENQLDTLADAICSIELYLEAIAENHSHAGTALDVAEQSMEKLGYPCPVVDEVKCLSPDADVHEQGCCEMEFTEQPESVAVNAINESAQKEAEDTALVTNLQLIAPDVDEEILEIFIEEADEELQKLAALVPMWVASSAAEEYLVDIQRSYHTLKGSGRMVGALAVGEFAWTLENLANKVIDGTVTSHDAIKSILTDSVSALAQLLEQVKGNPVNSGIDVNDVASQALLFSEPGAVIKEDVAGKGFEHSAEFSAGDEVEEQILDSGNTTSEATVPGQQLSVDLPVLSPDADAEIVEIFLEEAAEEIASLAAAIPAWTGQPGDEDALTTIRRSLHTLKGSGRMAGAMVVGEFSWCIETLINEMTEGAVQVNADILSLLGNVPDALSQLIVQVQGGAVPTIDTADMMQRANAPGRGETLVSAADETPVDDTENIEELADTVAADEADEADTEASLLDILRKECSDHLQAIENFLEEGDESRVVSDTLYRALHTLSGISESAEVTSISELAGDLNGYFDELHHAQQLLSQEAINVLRSSVMEISGAVQRLPDLSFDESCQRKLCDRIAALPRVEEQSAGDGNISDIPDSENSEADTVDAIDASATGKSDPFSSMDQELYEIFIEEVSEIIDSSEVVLRAWVEQPDNSEHMTEFQRQLHTIKGGARMVDIQAIGDLSHVLESLMTRVADGVIATSEDLFALFQESHDRLSEMLEQVKDRQMPVSATQLEARLDALWKTDCEPVPPGEAVSLPSATDESPDEAGIDADVAVEHERVQAEEPVAYDDDVAASENIENQSAHSDAGASGEAKEVTELPVSEPLILPEKVTPQKQTRVQGEQVRVQSDLLDEMVNYAGEINIYRSRMEQQVCDYRFNLAELDQTIARLRDQLRKMEMETEVQILFRYEQEADENTRGFDPLEMDRYSNLQQLSRSLIESISDLGSLKELMENTTRESETLLLQQSRVSTDLQEGLMRTRMIPFSSLASRLRRIVRQSARQLGKKVGLELLGADSEMDRTVIERIIAPLEHMLRNAVAHGIEIPEQRMAADKQASGSITITFDREGPEIILRIEDDGAGIDIEAIRARAKERGLMSDDSKLTDNDVMQFILQTGFSTAAEVTQISGRGVGLDVVNSEVKQLGGSLHIESTAGLGTLFTVRLPYTLAINQALLATAGEELFCIPLGSVEGVVRANCEELAACYSSDECVYEYAGNEYRLKHLGTLLNTGAVNLDKPHGQVPVLLVRVGDKRIALQVEDLMGSREIVIKPVGTQFSTVDCVSGATILGDGSVVMILDMADVARMNVRAQLPEVPVAQPGESRLVVMVVDDSITVRKVTTRLLERNGYKVLTAKDGVDAMGQLQDVVPDMMLLDIEMPRMDGFELATHMRNDTRLKHVPIIMITSRTGDKHRERAQQIGVNNYLGKPYQENDLLDSIHRIIGASITGAVA
jgi:chemosensory pili system protein ChpA (sensor histidine kinase/response regulator)